MFFIQTAEDFSSHGRFDFQPLDSTEGRLSSASLWKSPQAVSQINVTIRKTHSQSDPIQVDRNTLRFKLSEREAEFTLKAVKCSVYELCFIKGILHVWKNYIMEHSKVIKHNY